MAQCFGTGDTCMLEGFEVERREIDDPIGRRPIREYCFRLSPETTGGCAYARTDEAVIGAESPADDETASFEADAGEGDRQEPLNCAYAAPMPAPMDAPMKTPCAPNAPIDHVIPRRGVSETPTFQNSDVKNADSTEVMGPHRRIGATGSPAIAPDASPCPPADPGDDHVRWVASLPLAQATRYYRAFGRAWYAGNGKEECQRLARQAVEGSRQVGAGSKTSIEAEHPDDEEVVS